jgi:hypothetical protein
MVEASQAVEPADAGNNQAKLRFSASKRST